MHPEHRASEICWFFLWLNLVYVYMESMTHLHICKRALRASCDCMYTWTYVYTYTWSKQSDVDVYMESVTHLRIDKCALRLVCDSDVDVYIECVTHLHIYKCALRASCDCMYTWMYVYTYTWSKQSDAHVRMEFVTHLQIYTCVYIQSHKALNVIYKQSRDTSSDCLVLSAVYQPSHERQTVTRHSRDSW